jgi:hypothetical protein
LQVWGLVTRVDECPTLLLLIAPNIPGGSRIEGVLLVSADFLNEADLPAVTAVVGQVSAALERAWGCRS